MPWLNASSRHARARSASTPTPYVSQDPREISDTSRSLLPSLRYFIPISSNVCSRPRGVAAKARLMGHPEIAYIEVAGRRIAYRLRRGNVPTLLFLPGYASDMEGAK